MTFKRGAGREGRGGLNEISGAGRVRMVAVGGRGKGRGGEGREGVVVRVGKCIYNFVFEFSGILFSPDRKKTSFAE